MKYPEKTTVTEYSLPKYTQIQVEKKGFEMNLLENGNELIKMMQSTYYFSWSLIFEPVHDKTYYKTCATREDWNQPANPRSLIRVLVDRMCPLQPPGLSKDG